MGAAHELWESAVWHFQGCEPCGRIWPQRNPRLSGGTERLAPPEQPLAGWRRHGGWFLTQMRKQWCSNCSSAQWSPLRPGNELLQLSWAALLGRLSGPSTVCYYFYKGSSVCWIMFGQLLMHSCGWGWVRILLLYFQTVDLCAGEQGGMERKQVGESECSHHFLHGVLE